MGILPLDNHIPEKPNPSIYAKHGGQTSSFLHDTESSKEQIKQLLLWTVPSWL